MLFRKTTTTEQDDIMAKWNRVLHEVADECPQCTLPYEKCVCTKKWK